MSEPGVLTLENLEKGFKRVKEMNDSYTTPTLFFHPALRHFYFCMLTRMYWKQAYREWRMFRRACEMGWMNGRY